MARHTSLNRRLLAGATAVLAAASLTATLAAPAVAATKVPSSRTGSDPTNDVRTDTGSESGNSFGRTDIESMSGRTLASGEFRFAVSFDYPLSWEEPEFRYTRTITTKAVDIKKKDGKVVSRTPYQTRITYVNDSQELPVVERLVNGSYTAIDCYVEAMADEDDTSFFNFTFDKACLGKSIDTMTTEFYALTEEKDSDGTWSDKGFLGAMKP